MGRGGYSGEGKGGGRGFEEGGLYRGKGPGRLGNSAQSAKSSKTEGIEGEKQEKNTTKRKLLTGITKAINEYLNNHGLKKERHVLIKIRRVEGGGERP